MKGFLAMSFVKSTSLPIPYETGFPEPDLFGLKHKGKTLSRALEVAEGPVVIAFDGPWGCGKSFFLRAWSKDHDLKADVIYFDAFEHDYLDDPLISLVQAIVPKVQTSASEKLINGAKRVIPLVGKIALGWATLGAVKELGDLGDIVAAEMAGEATEALDTLWKIETGRHDAMRIFKESLEALVKESSNSMLVIIIDELDRCRPDYALQMLETIKHFFAVDGVHFVLGTNLNQLSNSVRSRYGERVNAEKYLQRFIHATLGARQRSTRSSYEKRAEIQYFTKLDSNYDFESVSEILAVIPGNTSMTFRDTERLYTMCKIIHPSENAIEREILLTLCIVKSCEPSWITELVDGTLDYQKLVKFFGLKSVENIGDTYYPNALRVLATAIGFHDINSLPELTRPMMKTRLKDGKERYLSELASRELDSIRVR
ncbi:KAP P-loop [Roseovarius sp. TM1035]|uniref:KAP family P-loop NTPase fold protein n=1 Tax=Roseovarius sp. TM1035 TaxID=391613 RepID=UPI0001556D48|nr:KAP P-loop [Roseovarius sp. TM1035]EDM33022.1 KAP P-loop [Roseovarius sp. TM1035]